MEKTLKLVRIRERKNNNKKNRQVNIYISKDGEGVRSIQDS